MYITLKLSWSSGEKPKFTVLHHCMYVQILLMKYYLFAGGGVDYDFGPHTITFPAGKLNTSINVSIINDIIAEGNESFHFTINPNLQLNYVTVGTPDKTVLTIVDDDGKNKFVLNVHI